MFEDIETISMLAKDGSNGNSTITLDITDVLDLADSGFAAFANTVSTARKQSASMARPAMSSIWVLIQEPGCWQRVQRSPDGYTAYSHVTSGLLDDAYLFIQTGITVNGIGT